MGLSDRLFTWFVTFSAGWGGQGGARQGWAGRGWAWRGPAGTRGPERGGQGGAGAGTGRGRLVCNLRAT